MKKQFGKKVAILPGGCCELVGQLPSRLQKGG